MSSFESMGQDSFSRELAHLQSRLDAARSTQNHGRVKLLELEIAEIEDRRAQLLAHFTRGVIVAGFASSDPRHVPVPKIEPEELRRNSGAPSKSRP
jgi:hypothetical protein